MKIEIKRGGMVAAVVILLFAFSFSVNAAPVTSGLVSWWKFEQNATDSQGSNHGTVNGGAGYTTSTPGPASSYSLSLNGTSSYVGVADSASLDITGAITVEAWVNLNSLSGMVIVAKNDGASSGYMLSYNPNSSAFYLRVNGLTTPTMSGTTTPTTGQWYHVAGVYDNSNLRIYVNGTEDSSTGATGSINANNFALNIGASSPAGNYFNGALDDVRIYNRALSPSEIQQNYNAIIPEPSVLLLMGSGLLSLWASFRRRGL